MHSSRSHHVFQIRISTVDKLGKPQQSLLNIVDLAGSERRHAINFYEDELAMKKGLASTPKLSKRKDESRLATNKSQNYLSIPAN
mmetsp:Transcript_9537/g.14592  ORF Transcript_9537/g.14592 Transcript_9537/m.14592 type:complete len:85 (-) Transcript_9537:489-743(-)